MVRTEFNDHHWDEFFDPIEPLLPPWGLWPTYHKLLILIPLFAVLVYAGVCAWREVFCPTPSVPVVRIAPDEKASAANGCNVWRIEGRK